MACSSAMWAAPVEASAAASAMCVEPDIAPKAALARGLPAARFEIAMAQAGRVSGSRA